MVSVRQPASACSRYSAGFGASLWPNRTGGSLASTSNGASREVSSWPAPQKPWIVERRVGAADPAVVDAELEAGELGLGLEGVERPVDLRGVDAVADRGGGDGRHGRKVTGSRLDAGKRPANRRGAALTGELPGVGGRPVCCAPMPRLTRPSPVLFLCLFVSQAALLVLSPVLPDVARDLGVSTATAGQLRSLSGLTGGATAVLLAAGAPAPGPARPPERRRGARRGRLGAQRGRAELRAPRRRAGRRRHRHRPARRGRHRRRGGVAAGRAAAGRARVGDRRHAGGLDRGHARRRRRGGRQLARGMARPHRSPRSPRSRSSGGGRRIARRRALAGGWAHGGTPPSRGSPSASCSPTRPGRAC